MFFWRAGSVFLQRNFLCDRKHEATAPNILVYEARKINQNYKIERRKCSSLSIFISNAHSGRLKFRLKVSFPSMEMILRSDIKRKPSVLLEVTQTSPMGGLISCFMSKAARFFYYQCVIGLIIFYLTFRTLQHNSKK